MNGGVKRLLVTASFAAAGCAAAPNAVEIRPIADPVSKLRPGADLLADAKGQLALGNVGLALEAFRKAARLHPDNPEAYAGMAACYEAMRRYDLAESKYQEALALAPHNAVLLGRLAAALDQQGKSEAAAEVRGEIAQLASASAVLDQAEADPLPAAASLEPAQTVTATLPAPVLTSTQAIAVAAPAPNLPARDSIALPGTNQANWASAEPAEPTETAPRLSAASLIERQPVSLLGNTAPQLKPVSMDPLAPVFALPSEPLLPRFPAPVLASNAPVHVIGGLSQNLAPAPLGALAPIIGMPSEAAAKTGPQIHPVMASVLKPGPRLERMSLGEVALLTSGGPAWKGQVVAHTPQKLTLRWVPVKSAESRPNIRLLNAARTQGLAARNRDYLLDRGWRKIEIGDASMVRERSLVLYPAMRPQTGRSLAAQFGFRAQPTTTSDVFVVFLGRDAAAMRTASTRG